MQRMGLGGAALAGILIVSATGAFAAEELEVGTADREALLVTVYNRDLGLVRDTRAVTLAAGDNLLALGGLSPALLPETLIIEGEGVSLREQSFQFDLLSQRRLLEKSLGETVWLVRRHPETGEESLHEAELLSMAEGPLLRVGERIMPANANDIAFKSLPAGLRARPALVARLVSEAAGTRSLAVQYLTGGLTWKADYLAEITAEEGQAARLTLTGLITLTNTSGTDYPEARLRLAAGEVNRAAQPVALRGATAMMESAMAQAPMPAAQAVGDLHLYSLEHPVSLADRETKQVLLLRAPEVGTTKDYRFTNLVEAQGGAEEIGPLPAEVVLQFENETKAGGPGRALPAGIVRVYRMAGDGAAGEAPLFLGEDRLGHTPVGEEVELTIARAFDVTGRALRTSFERISNTSYETGQEITIANAKETDVKVTVIGSLPPGWRMLEESVAHERETANRIAWRLTVPAGGEARFHYRLRVTRP